MKTRETIGNLEKKFKEQGFVDGLRFLELARHLDIKRLQGELNSWESIRHVHEKSSTHMDIAIKAIVERYQKEHEEFLRLADQYASLEDVNSLYSDLVPKHEEFRLLLKERGYA